MNYTVLQEKLAGLEESNAAVMLFHRCATMTPSIIHSLHLDPTPPSTC
jgi:hypothetical protein